jgi:hypothetical protein
MRSAAWAASRSPREASGKAHLDIEPAFGAGTWGHLGAVGVDDGADDGQAESVSVGVPDSLAAELPEGLEDTLDLRGEATGRPARGLPKTSAVPTTQPRCNAAGTTRPAWCARSPGPATSRPRLAGAAGLGTTVTQTLVGTFVGLIVVVVVGTMFITGEYRRGLIRTTLAASPRRGRLLAAKAIVIGAVAFLTGLAAASAVVTLGQQTLRHNGVYVLPATTLTELRLVAGTAALVAVAAVLALAIGAALRRMPSADQPQARRGRAVGASLGRGG